MKLKLDENSENVCNFCNKIFSRKENLKRHIASIHEEKKLKCVFCEQIFSRKDRLKSHVVLVHTKKELFSDIDTQDFKKCTLCGKNFSRNDHLKRHIEVVHEGKKPKKTVAKDETGSNRDMYYTSQNFIALSA